MASSPSKREVEVHKHADCGSEPSNGPQERSTEPAALLGIEGISGMEHEIGDGLARSVGRPRVHVCGKPCMSLFRSNTFSHFRAPAWRPPGPWDRPGILCEAQWVPRALAAV